MERNLVEAEPALGPMATIRTCLLISCFITRLFLSMQGPTFSTSTFFTEGKRVDLKFCSVADSRSVTIYNYFYNSFCFSQNCTNFQLIIRSSLYFSHDTV